MKSIGIRKETKSVWERRTPIIPHHVPILKREYGIQVYVESSEKRVFGDNEYECEGAVVKEILEDVPFIFGVKEIPPSLIQSDRVYIFFSHVHKGQPQNMEMLKKLLELKCTLIDYERITEKDGKRLIGFGYHAGISGMVETLHALGKRLVYLGIDNPFCEIKQPKEYRSVSEIKQEVFRVAKKIAESGIPNEVSPLIFGFTGSGQVYRGTQEIFEILPYEDLTPDELRGIKSKKNNRHCVYRVHFGKEHLVEPIESGKRFNREDYYANPDKYKPIFNRYWKYLSVLVNGLYWEPRFPKYVSKEDVKSLWKTPQFRLMLIGDITCDIEGSVEITMKSTDPGNPCFVYNPETENITDGVEGEGIVIMAVDILPTEVALDASVYFSHKLTPLIPRIVGLDYDVPWSRFSPIPETNKAVIVYKGELTPDYLYLKEFL